MHMPKTTPVSVIEEGLFLRLKVLYCKRTNGVRKEGAHMKKLLITLLAFGLLMTPFAVYGQPAQLAAVVAESGQTATDAPPVSQALVPEGDFAVQLAAALELGTPATEGQAEDMLTSVGIEPQNGWIADYPVTPIIIGELQDAVAASAAAYKIPMGKDEALQAFQHVATGFGLAVSPGTDQYTESQPPTTSEYVEPTTVDDYYSEEGPPVITYYLPPPDYYYLYSWVPYPFWFSSFYFPGFFILNDFDFTVAGHFYGHRFHHVVTNHFFDRRLHEYLRVDPRMGDHLRTFRARAPGFNSPRARRDARSIFNRSFERETPGNAATATTGRRFEGPVRQGTAGRTFTQPRGFETQGRIMRSPSIRSSGNLGVTSGRSFSRPSEGFARPVRPQRPLNLASRGSFSGPSGGFTQSFNPPSRSFSVPQGSSGSFGDRHGDFGGFQRGGFGVFHGGGGFRR
jgi:hypothetical protein